MFAATVAGAGHRPHGRSSWDMPGHGRSASPDDPVGVLDRARSSTTCSRSSTTSAPSGPSCSATRSAATCRSSWRSPTPTGSAALVLVDTGPGYRNDAARDGWNEMADRYAGDLETQGLDGLPGGAELTPGVHRIGRRPRPRRPQRADAARRPRASTGCRRSTCRRSSSSASTTSRSSRARSTWPARSRTPTLVVIDGAGHAPPVTHPDRSTPRCATFLGGAARMTEHGRRPSRRQGRGSPSTGTPTWRCSTGGAQLVESGWATPSWPAEWYGRGLPGWADADRRTRSSPPPAPSAPPSAAAWASPRRRCSPTASDELKRRLLPRAITGEDTWCQLFSEPAQRLRPRRPGDARRAGRRRVGRQRPEAVEHERPPRRPRPAARPHRPRRAQAPRHHLLRAADAPARRRGPPAAPDERARVVQRGVPDRRPRAGGEPRRRARATAGASP